MEKVSIPVRISPMFWLTAAIIGWLNSRSLVGTLIWVVIIFVSILVHEYGHALMSRFFGQFPRIELVAFGGLTYPEGPVISLGREFLVVLSGPVFSFGLYVLGALLLKVPTIAGSAAMPIIQAFSLINLFWTIINLFPVLPLDGGQLMRITLESMLGVKGLRIAIGSSIAIAVCVGVVTIILGWFFIGAIFLLFAFQNLQSWKVSQVISRSDQNQNFHKLLIEAEEYLLQGNTQAAAPLLENLRASTQKGILFITATQYLARIRFEKGLTKETYQLLLSIKENLSDDFMMLLHFVAFEMKDYKLVYELSGRCFQREPSLEVAIRNAIASASLNQADQVVGWLEAALREGLQNLIEITQDEVFNTVKNNPQFIKFLNSHRM
ncbi:MAG: site-2 protease family protein [Chlamydiota bacterium]